MNPRFGTSTNGHVLPYGSHLPFPEGTSGFLYFRRPKPCPNLAFGSLRFRMVPKNDPALFEAGHDLVYEKTGTPWEIHLISLKSIGRYAGIYNVLITDGTISDEDDLKLTQMLESAKGFKALERQPKKVLESILDTFTLDFSTRSGIFLVLDSSSMYKFDLYPVWTRSYTVDGKLNHTSWYSGKHTSACLFNKPLVIDDALSCSSRPYIKLSKILTAGQLTDPCNVGFGWAKGTKFPSSFPPGTRGFFYYHRTKKWDYVTDEETGEETLISRPTHVAASQLRFRLVPDNASSSSAQELFHNGTDLMSEAGLYPWNIHALAMQKRPQFHRLFNCVVPPHERALIESFISKSRENTQFHDGTYFRTSHFLDSVLEPFPLDLDHKNIILRLLDPDCVTTLSLRHIFTVQPSPKKFNSAVYTPMYSGKALVRFELVNVTRKVNTPTVRLAIRILEWIERPKDVGHGLPAQQEGDLLKKCDSATMEEKIWTKKSFRRILPPASVQMLLDAYPYSETVGLGMFKSGRASVQEDNV
ncbi:hypothetical protein MD484_g5712, partial [Candolleomyces efflorescens]